MRTESRPTSIPVLTGPTFDGTSYVHLPWEQMGEYNFALAQQIIASKQTFDVLIPLANGGLTMSRDMLDAAKIKRLSSIRILAYRGINQSGEPELIEGL